MVISDDMLARLKACELEILKVYIDICDRLNLKYYLVEGSLLGAVRHKGFIPWDDDIDVGMPRTDYERFLKEAQQYLPPYYFFNLFTPKGNILQILPRLGTVERHLSNRA